MTNALTGLTASARSAEVVSANVANAMTEGYGKRELILTSRADDRSGNGVYIGGVKRIVNEVAINDRRVAEAGLAYSSTTGTALSRIEDAIGLPGETGSLAGRIAAFESALISASSQPQSEPRLAAVVQSSENIVTTFADISDTIQEVRRDADNTIASEVDALNTALQKVKTLNESIFRLGDAEREASGLLDQRQQVIDEISEIIPVRQVPRDRSMVALFSENGAILLDGRAAEFEFTQSGFITPAQTVQNGSLSGLLIDGQTVDTLSDSSLIAGGRLAALFETRDEIAPAAQADLDAVARDLVERFQTSGVDPTLSPGDPGLFTDLGSAFDPADEVGLSARLSVNAAVDEESGGTVLAIRTGLGAGATAEVGDATQINAFIAAVTDDRVPASGPFAGVSRKPTELISDFLSGISTDRQIAEDEQSYNQSRVDLLTQSELAGGVDTDEELQKLLLIEKAYAANARVISTIDELLDTMLRI
ncbi:MAG: flagellar hook-associated protein FlgK [Pseudomonadota bacterium]